MRPRYALAAFQVDSDAARSARNPRDGRLLADQLLDCNGGDLGIVLTQRIQPFEDNHLRAEPPMRLRHLKTDRAAANHNQRCGALFVLKNRLIGEIRNRVEPINGRDKSR